MRSHIHQPSARRGALAALSVVALLASACGRADDDDGQADGVASLRDLSTADDATEDGTGDRSTGDGSEAETELEAPDDLEEAMALYDQCLQDHGVAGTQLAQLLMGENKAQAVLPDARQHGRQGRGEEVLELVNVEIEGMPLVLRLPSNRHLMDFRYQQRAEQMSVLLADRPVR